MKTKIFFQTHSQRPFFMTLLNSLFILLGSLLIYFSVFTPIENNVYGEKIEQFKKDEETLFSIGEQSKLIKRFDSGQLYTVNNYYEYYLRVLLKYNYEHSSYDLEEDPDKYNDKKNSFEPFIDIAVTENTISDDFMGDFFTKFIVGKEDEDGNLVLDYKGENPKQYFYYGVLDIDGEGSAFFNDSIDGNYPLFKEEVRSALFAVNFNKNYAGEGPDIDKAFLEFFLQKLNYSGDFLMKYKEYGYVLDRYNSTYDVLFEYDQISTFTSISVSFLVFIFVVPLCNKKRQNLAEIILKRIYLKDKGEEGGVVSFTSFIIRALYGIIKYFYLITIFSFFTNPAVGFTPLIALGSFPISIFTLGFLTILVSAISLSISMIRPDKKNLENLISKTRIYVIEKDYSEQ